MADINSGLRSGRPSRGFIDSVLYRFALLALPLRQGELENSFSRDVILLCRGHCGVRGP